MLLSKLSVKNYCCYEDLANVPCHQLTVFIGENDAGKSVLLDTIEILLTDRLPKQGEYYQKNDTEQAEELTIIGEFELQSEDIIPEKYLSEDKKHVKLTKKFALTGRPSCYVEAVGFKDERVSRFAGLNAGEQKEVLESTGQQPAANATLRTAQLNTAIRNNLFPREVKNIEIQFSELKPYLPRFQYIASTDYKNPDTIIEKNLQDVVDQAIRIINSDTGESQWHEHLQKVEKIIRNALQTKVDEIKEILIQANPKLKDVSLSTGIDFSRSVTAKRLMLDTGDGLQMVEAFGEGTKKKLWMGLLDWIKGQEDVSRISVIRVYDEPDVNLDYAAERKLFSDILDTTKCSEFRTQVFVATHTVTFIDRAPAKSVNLINVDSTGKRSIQYLESDDSLKDFLSEVGRSVGISNSALFYERAFIVVEGESEEQSLPIFYSNVYGRSMIEDGIVLVNLRTCGAWSSVLRILQSNKSHITVMLLDTDCKDPNSSGYITSDKLEEFGYPRDWQNSNCFYMGNKEFEDAFSTSDIIAILNSHYPRADTTLWEDHHVDQFRLPNIKFSTQLMQEIRSQAEKRTRPAARKPDFAEKLALHCCTNKQIPNAILEAFKLARAKSGCPGDVIESPPSQANSAS
ncbi:MAG: AAA family ATPase [Acidobacteria bacterium]|nr:AAA family ATPase [Acidobacteriota bacterium]